MEAKDGWEHRWPLGVPYDIHASRPCEGFSGFPSAGRRTPGTVLYLLTLPI